MRYYVIADDGNRYGPADLPTLEQWMREGRLMPHQSLELEGSSQRLPVMQVVTSSTASPGQAYPGYYRPGGLYGDTGQSDIIAAWWLGAIGLLCGLCGVGVVLSALGVYYANRAKTKGHPSGQAAFIFNIVVLALALLASVGGQFLGLFF